MAVETLASMDKASPFFFLPDFVLLSVATVVVEEVGVVVAEVETELLEALDFEGFLFGMGDTSEGGSVFV